MKNRSKARLISGKIYFSLKKYFHWYFSLKKFSKKINNKYLKQEIFSHKSLVLRKLEGVDEKLQINKFTNIGIAIKNINGLIIKPGERFSYWKLIGRPTKKKGYKKGVILSHGKFIEGYGGGVCQLSNLLYWMFLHTDLEVTERYRHSYDVFPDYKRKVPFGTGATCYFPFLDLEVINNTSNEYQIILFLKDGYLNGKILLNNKILYTYEIIEKNHKILHFNKGTYTRHNEIYRQKIALDGKLLSEEFITENNAFMMYNPIIAYNKKYLIEEKN